MNKNILGTGWRLAPEVDRRGNVRLISAEPAIEQSIRFILGTAPGERVMRPDFGCQIHELAFAPNNMQTWGQAEFYVREALVKWEPRIILDKVTAGADEHDSACMVIHVEYTVRETNSFYNLVYPFYLEQGEQASREQFEE
jgi:hypothetical protein